MKREDLIDALEYIDDDLIQEADQTRNAEKSTGDPEKITPLRRKASIRRWGAIAAGLAVFMPNELFNTTFGRDADDFSGYMSDEPITDIDSEYIAKEITSKDIMKVADQLDHSMGSYMVYFQYVCVIVAAIILYLLTKIIIEKNERAISMTKILGYEKGEIASLYLIPTALVVFFSEFISMYLGFKLMDVFWKIMMKGMGGWFAFIMPVSGFVKQFLLVFAAYLIITIFDFIRIKKIPKVLALKNME